MSAARLEPILPSHGLWHLQKDSANAYAVVKDGRALLIDPVVRWTNADLKTMGARTVDAVVLLRPSARGLLHGRPWKTPIHLNAEAEGLLDRKYLAARQRYAPRTPVSSFYDPPTDAPERMRFDLGEGVNFEWRGWRFCFLKTPGQTEVALTLLMETPNRLFAFCGDAVCEDGRYWNPHHLEWDHWTSTGIRAALRGLDRLSNLPVTDLLPSHGNPVRKGVRAAIRKTRRHLAVWSEVKEAFVPGVNVKPWKTEEAGHGAHRLLPRLYHLGASAYLVAGKAGAGLLIDALPSHREAVRHFMRLGKIARITATATHYHCDHVDGLNQWRRLFAADVVLTKPLSRIIGRPNHWRHLPFLGEPLEGTPEIFATHEAPLDIGGLKVTWHDMPGQTRFHDGISIRLDETLVLFSGDNFFSPLRYNGTGGCCVANQSAPECYGVSAEKVLRLKPDLIATGHSTAFHFSPQYFRAVQKWAVKYRSALEQLHHPDDHDGYFSRNS